MITYFKERVGPITSRAVCKSNVEERQTNKYVLQHFDTKKIETRHISKLRTAICQWLK